MTEGSEQRPTHGDARRSEAAREAMDRANRRLNLLEFIILGGAALAAVVGGWLTAWLARNALGVPFRLTWVLASLLLFVVPGVLVWSRERRAQGASSSGKRPEQEPDPTNG